MHLLRPSLVALGYGYGHGVPYRSIDDGQRLVGGHGTGGIVIGKILTVASSQYLVLYVGLQQLPWQTVEQVAQANHVASTLILHALLPGLAVAVLMPNTLGTVGHAHSTRRSVPPGLAA